MREWRTQYPFQTKKSSPRAQSWCNIFMLSKFNIDFKEVYHERGLFPNLILQKWKIHYQFLTLLKNILFILILSIFPSISLQAKWWTWKLLMIITILLTPSTWWPNNGNAEQINANDVLIINHFRHSIVHTLRILNISHKWQVINIKVNHWITNWLL